MKSAPRASTSARTPSTARTPVSRPRRRRSRSKPAIPAAPTFRRRFRTAATSCTKILVWLVARASSSSTMLVLFRVHWRSRCAEYRLETQAQAQKPALRQARAPPPSPATTRLTRVRHSRQHQIVSFISLLIVVNIVVLVIFWRKILVIIIHVLLFALLRLIPFVLIVFIICKKDLLLVSAFRNKPHLVFIKVIVHLKMLKSVIVLPIQNKTNVYIVIQVNKIRMEHANQLANQECI